MNQTNEYESVSNPYKGQESYQVEDAHLFFGRERESEQIRARILSSRFVILHAQSGAGKTSLLNARVVPEIEAKGWMPVRIRLGIDPVIAIRESTLEYLLPPIAAERIALNSAIQALDVPENNTLQELLNAYDKLKVTDRRRRDLIKPIKYCDSEGNDSRSTPFISRLIRSSIDYVMIEEQFNTYTKLSHYGKIRLHEGTVLSELLQWLASDDLVSSQRQLRYQLDTPQRSLVDFFVNLIQTYHALNRSIALVLIMDQFEELFTQFVDPGLIETNIGPDRPDWKLKYELVDQLQELFHYKYHPVDSQDELIPGSMMSLLPIRFILSMRSEFISRLTDIRRFVPDLDSDSYLLEMLSKDAANQAIQLPALEYGFTYEKKCFDAVLNQLTQEDRYVEPPHLSIVCAKLWVEQWRSIADINIINNQEANEMPKIRWKIFDALGGVLGVLSTFLVDYLDSLEFKEQLVTLELLEPLITAGGTRNIVQRRQLEDVPYRDSEIRIRLLDHLAKRSIVRTEKRFGDDFVEITHEVLTTPIRNAINERLLANKEYREFLVAVQELALTSNSDFRSDTEKLLHISEFNSLNNNCDDVVWNEETIEVMFRSAVVNSKNSGDVFQWATRYSRGSRKIKIELLLERIRNIESDKVYLNSDELAALNRVRTSLDLSSVELEAVLRGTLHSAGPAHKKDIQYWTKRMII